MTVIKLFLVFYHCTARTSGPLIEISDCQDLYTFHRRGWLTSPPLRLFLCGVWRSGAAQAAIFQIRLHFVSGEKKVGYESRAITRAVSDVFSFHATDPGVFYASYRVLKVRFSSIECKESFKILLVFFPRESFKRFLFFKNILKVSFWRLVKMRFFSALPKLIFTSLKIIQVFWTLLWREIIWQIEFLYYWR